MTGSPRPGSPPRTDAEWARSVEERMDDVETGPATRVGDWVISTDHDSGDLIASHARGGSRRLAVVPPEGADPDAVDDGFPVLRLERYTDLAVPNNDTVLMIPWDNVDILMGDWGIGGSETISSITVPEDGIYRVGASTFYSSVNSTSSRTVLIHVDGSVVRYNSLPGASNLVGPSVTDIIALSEGQIIEVGVSKGGAFAANLGTHGSYPLIVTSFALERIR